MGTKVQFDNHLSGLSSMRDLDHESDGTHWPLFYGENNLPNQQYYYGLFPRPAADSSPDANKDTMKQTILKHEAVFKNQVIELHRLYRVQKDLMGEFERQEQYKHMIQHEAASSSTFVFANSVCKGPQYPVPEMIQLSESRPKKLRKIIDLELPPDDAEQVDQQSSFHVLADLNEPLLCEETDVNGRHWFHFPSMVKEGGIKDEVRSNSLDLNAPLPNADCETESGGIKWLLDINLPCHDPDDVARCSGHVIRNMIDLNSCPMEEDEELARVAAEAIVSISSIQEEPVFSEDALRWFANIVCSDLHRDDDDDDDYLEEMTLKLTECTVDDYFPTPPILIVPAMEEQIRRGPTRRGRPRRDFQRDILPGIASLARYEVTEDLQTFGGLMTSTGHTWHSRSGSGRGRRRAVVASWGKTTRRPRRQRCSLSNFTSVAFT